MGLWILLASAGAAGLLPASVGQCAGKIRAPNIVLIVADDLGFSDLGCYGSEIPTPAFNRLAKHGLRFTQFYHCGRECPTRAALLTGLYPHQTGIALSLDDFALPGYRGNLNDHCVTIAQVLHGVNYQTMAVGKWALTRFTQLDDSHGNWPLQRGFEKFLGTLDEVSSYFDPVTLFRGNHVFNTQSDFYYTDAIGRQAARFIEEAARSPAQPFFLYASFTAPHWPLQAPGEVVLSYRGKYVRGWDTLREQRRDRLARLGLIRDAWRLPSREPGVPLWEAAPSRGWQQQRMEVYAAQIDLLDQAVGWILDALAGADAEKNTLVMFLSASGPSAEELAPNTKSPGIPARTRQGRPLRVGNVNDIAPGAADTIQSYGPGWAGLSSTPFRMAKHALHEGGIASPFIVRWPAVIANPGEIVTQPCHVLDILPTLLEVGRGEYPKNFLGIDIQPPEGESLLPLLTGKNRVRGPMFWELEGNRALRDTKWKLVSHYPGPWELYDMDADRTEMQNQAARFPVVVKDMALDWQAWAKRVHVAPWGKREEGEGK